MITPATDGKMLVNAQYHSAVVSCIAAGYARLGRMAIGSSLPKLDLKHTHPHPRDVGMVVADVALAMATKDMLIKQGVIPADIMKYCYARLWFLVNALAFSGSNHLFSILRSSGVDEERKCHDKAVEKSTGCTGRMVSKTD